MGVENGQDRIAEVHGVELCLQTFGEPTDPPLLLIAGISSSMDWWPPDFCQRLAAGSRFVIRYDQRDTGRSVSYPKGEPGYTGSDLIADAVGILDELKLREVHVVGISAGGAAAQVLTLDYPDRVLTLTLISTSGGAGDSDLPGVSKELRAVFANDAEEPDWADPTAVIEYVVDQSRPYGARSVPFDDAEVRTIAERSVARSTDMAASMTNHALADGSGSWRHRLGEIAVPTLVIHGDEDPLFPLPHGRALADEIPGATLLTLEHVGHELPQRTWDVVVPVILAHTALTWQQEADRLAALALSADDPTGWFERLYSEAINGGVDMPWDRTEANPLLAEWVKDRQVDGSGRRAVVVGCGLGADAELLASVGFDTTAFDISPAAVGIARQRRPDSPVDYRVANLLELPVPFVGNFDLVVDNYTVQALPLSLRVDATAGVRSLVAPGGSLLVIMVARADTDDLPDGPPWPLSRADINKFGSGALTERRVEFLPNAEGRDHWRAEFGRST